MPRDYLLDNEEDPSMPYDRITDRDPLEDVSNAGQAQDLLDDGDDLSVSPPSPIALPPNPVRDAIKNRRMGGGPPQNLREYANDPLMQDYNMREKGLQGYRDSKINSDRIQNIGQAALSAARGVNAPISNDSLFSNMSRQGEGALKSNEEDMDRRQRIVNAIEGRKSREFMATEGAKNRAALFGASQDNKAKNRGVQINRILGMTEKELREDPIAKPSEINLASLEKARMVLDNPNLPLTSEVLSDAEQDIASAMQLRGQGATEGKIKRTELNTIGRMLAQAKQKWGNKIVDLKKEEPALVAQISKLNHALSDDYKSTITDRKNSILDDKMAIWGDDPIYSDKLKALRASVNKRTGLQVSPEMAKNSPPGSSLPPVPTGMQQGGLINSANAGEGRSVVKKQFSPSRNQTKLIYSDGTEEIIDGQQ